MKRPESNMGSESSKGGLPLPDWIPGIIASAIHG